jgi:hypothetical protein
MVDSHDEDALLQRLDLEVECRHTPRAPVDDHRFGNPAPGGACDIERGVAPPW